MITPVSTALHGSPKTSWRDTQEIGVVQIPSPQKIGQSGIEKEVTAQEASGTRNELIPFVSYQNGPIKQRGDFLLITNIFFWSSKHF